MSKYKHKYQSAINIVESKEWFTYKDIPHTPAGHDTMKFLKGKGYRFEEEWHGGVKRFKWNGEMQPTGLRTAAANHAKKLINKPKSCPITNVGEHTKKFVMDHKDGRIVMEENDMDASTLTKENASEYFQWVSPAGNAIKREACRRCAKTNTKEPARIGSMAIPQGNYEGTCKGCYWSDPKEWFNSRGIHSET